MVRCGPIGTLEKACKYRNYFAVSSYLRGMDPDLCIKLHPEALYHAVCSGNTRVVKALLDYGYDPHGGGIFALSISRGYANIVKLLLDYGVKLNPKKPYIVYEAFICKHNKVISVLLKCGFDPFLFNHTGIIISMVEYLITHNLVSEDWVKENLNRIPTEVWQKLYK